jgi:cellulose synthase/poly-beta-1,6-N-acetylglucosamine synthase-like glycosyltransferase
MLRNTNNIRSCKQTNKQTNKQNKNLPSRSFLFTVQILSHCLFFHHIIFTSLFHIFVFTSLFHIFVFTPLFLCFSHLAFISCFHILFSPSSSCLFCYTFLSHRFLAARSSTFAQSRQRARSPHPPHRLRTNTPCVVFVIYHPNKNVTFLFLLSLLYNTTQHA